MESHIELSRPLPISATVNALSRFSRYVGEQGLPNCPAGVSIEVIAITLPMECTISVEFIENAYLDTESEVMVLYAQESGNRYLCNLREFSLGEASVIIQAASQAMPGGSESDRMIGLIDKWIADYQEKHAKSVAEAAPSAPVLLMRPAV